MSSTTAALLIAVLALLVAVVAGVLAVVAQRRHTGLLRRFRVLGSEAGGADVATVLARQSQRLAAERARVDAVEASLAGLREELSQTLQHVAVVRYDAFGDMGGQMSFSVAVVDAHGDGVVLSSIHARGESRTYAKGVVGGRSDITLSPEEQQALAAARGGA